MADQTGFLKYERALPPRRPVDVRILDWKDVYLTRDSGEDEVFPVAALRQQAARCMDCGIPFCHHGCPLGNLIPEWNDLARHRVNSEMVDIEALDGESAQWLRDVLVRYAADTDSPVAHALLADWGRWSEQFSVIMPRDYRRALEAQRMAEANGTDVDRALMEAARG